MKTTKFVHKEDKKETWYLIDAEGLPVGRVATMAAYILRGKHRPDFTPNIDMGDHIVVINAEKIIFSGNKLDQKKYYHHSGYMGGMKETSAREMLNKNPDRIIQNAVKGMLPKNRLGRKIIKKLRIYAGEGHPHEAQRPTKVEIHKGKTIKAVGI